MLTWFNKLYEKSELNFSLILIGIYCLLNSLANPITEIIEIDSLAAFIFNLFLSALIFLWIKKRGLCKYYGLCKPTVKANRFFWYIPLIIFMSSNLWLGVKFNLGLLGSSFYILNMLFVGFLEEIIFRGFLFKAIAKDNLKLGLVISSVTFGLGHILNLFNGSGMNLVSNICQIIGAVFVGFLFVVIFLKSSSIIPCIITHSVNNAVSVFANETAFSDKNQILVWAINIIIVGLYSLILCKNEPKISEFSKKPL